jgi:hypothetical protein
MKKLLSSLFGVAVVTATFLYPLIALAQEAAGKLAGTELGAAAADSPIGDVAQTGLTLYEMLIPILVAGLLWVKAHLANWIRSKTKNETLAGIMVRLNESVFESVKAVNEQMKDLIGKAKDPASPGGVKITEAEAKQLKDAALGHVKAYWGKKGMKEMAKVLGFGGFFGLGSDSSGLDKLIANKIEAAVNDVKKDARNPK